MSGYLTVDQILEAQDLDEREMDVPEWGGKIKIRAITNGQRHKIRTKATRGGTIDEERMQLLLFIAGVVEPKFSEEHAGALRNKSSGVFDRVLTEIANVSHFNVNGVTTGQTSAEAVDQAEAEFRL